MRIVFALATADLAGGVRVVATYARLLKQRGHRVTVVSTLPLAPPLRARVKSVLRGRGWPRAPDPGPSHLDQEDVEHHRLDRIGPITDRDVPDADVVIATWWETAEWVAALSPSKGIKVHFVQDHETWGGPGDRVDAVYRLPLPKIVISAFLRDVLRNQYQQEPIALIGNGVDTARFDAPARGKQPVPTVGLTYSTRPNKGTDISLQAFGLAAKEVSGLKLVVMGNEPVARVLPLPSGTEFAFKARGLAVRDLYARCDAWLFGTRWEGFGLPVLEAMACRTPVIGTPAGAAPELIGEGGGILVPPEAPRAMGDAIRRLCAMTDAEWRALSGSARAVAERHGWDAAARLFEAALEGALRRERGQPGATLAAAAGMPQSG